MDMQSPSPNATPALTVTPSACPWGFNPQNRAPTDLERIQHDLCMLEQVYKQQGLMPAASWGLRTGLREILDDLWAAVETLARWLLDGITAIFPQAAQLIQDIAAGIANAWNLLQQNWPLVLGLIGLYLLTDDK
jgi:hypothetical protein